MTIKAEIVTGARGALQRAMTSKLTTDCATIFPQLALLQAEGAHAARDVADGGYLAFLLTPHSAKWEIAAKSKEPSSPGAPPMQHAAAVAFEHVQQVNAPSTSVPNSDADRLQEEVLKILSACENSTMRIDQYLRKVRHVKLESARLVHALAMSVVRSIQPIALDEARAEINEVCRRFHVEFEAITRRYLSEVFQFPVAALNVFEVPATSAKLKGATAAAADSARDHDEQTPQTLGCLPVMNEAPPQVCGGVLSLIAASATRVCTVRASVAAAAASSSSAVMSVREARALATAAMAAANASASSRAGSTLLQSPHRQQRSAPAVKTLPSASDSNGDGGKGKAPYEQGSGSASGNLNLNSVAVTLPTTRVSTPMPEQSSRPVPRAHVHVSVAAVPAPSTTCIKDAEVRAPLQSSKGAAPEVQAEKDVDVNRLQGAASLLSPHAQTTSAVMHAQASPSAGNDSRARASSSMGRARARSRSPDTLPNFNVNAYINSYTYASTSRSISQLQVQVFAPAHAHAPAPAATSKSTRDSVDLFEPAPRPTTSSSHQHRHHHHETNASALSRAALTYGMRPSTSAGLEHAHSKSSSTSSISGSGSAQHHTTLSTTSTSPTSWSAVVSGAVAEDCSDQASRNKFASDRNAHERTSNQENNKLPSSSPSRVRPSTGCAPASNSALLPAGSLSLKLNLAMPAGAADAKSMQQAQILSAYSLVPHAPRLAQPPRRALQLQLPGNCAGGVLPAPTVLSLKTSEREFYLKASATPTATLAHAHSTGRLHAPVSIQSTATARLLMSTPASLSGRPSTSSRGKTYPVVYSIPGTAAAPPMSSTRTPSGRGTNTLLGSSSNSNRCLPILQLPSVRMTPGRDILAQNYKAAQYCSGNADFKINGHRVVPHDLAVLSGGSTSSLGRRSVNASAWH